MKKAVVIYSGGMDSFVLLHKVLFAYEDPAAVTALSFDYGQRHRKELEFAHNECQRLGVEHRIVNLAALKSLVGSSALTGGTPVPEGHYAEESMKATVVPNRNMIMLSIAMAHAYDIGAGTVAYGAHSGDHAIYPDCRPEFVDGMAHMASIAHYTPLHLCVPFLRGNKTTILQESTLFGLTAADFARTWTCYKGGEKACGKCGSCQERLEAFSNVGWVDPLPYEQAQ